MNEPFIDNCQAEKPVSILTLWEDYSPVEPLTLSFKENDRALVNTASLPDLPSKISKPEVRSSLKAVTIESVLATVFYSILGGVLLSNFLLDLGASPVEIGMLSSIPQITNLLQPLGAYIGERTTSRRWFSLYIFGVSRLLWLVLVPAIWLLGSDYLGKHELVQLTLGIIWVTNILEALGRASWCSWLAALVKERLRGRYFGFRNSILGFVNFIGVPLLGLVVSKWPSDRLYGYGAILVLGIVLGLGSLVAQFFITDVNPKLVQATVDTTGQSRWQAVQIFLNNTNFLKFLLYSGFWSFAVNISAPFFNLYLLDNLAIDVSVVTIYNSLGVGANLLMLLFWGKLADRVGNRPLMVAIGVLVALTPLLWLVSGTDAIFLWFWFPLLHIVGGGTWAAIDLCSGNLMMSVAPLLHQSIYFAIAAAVPGLTGAIGITLGSFLATLPHFGGLSGVFAMSAVLRLAALVPLVFVQEHRSMPLSKFWRQILPDWWRKVPSESGELGLQPVIVQEPFTVSRKS